MNIIVKPLISEKMTRLTEAAAAPQMTRIQRDKDKPAPKVLNRYGFVVDKRANKIEIKKAVEQFYGVKVLDVSESALYQGRLPGGSHQCLQESYRDPGRRRQHRLLR